VIIPTRAHLDIEDVLDMTLLYRQTVLPIHESVYDLVRVEINLSFVFLSFDSQLICRWDVWWLDYDQMCECDTLDFDVYDRTDFWAVRSYYVWILPLMSLTGGWWPY